MANFIFFSFFLFLLNIANFSFAQSNGKGTLYFPVGWQIESDQDIKTAEFSKGSVTFKNTQTDSKFSYSFGTQTSITKEGKRFVVFLGKKILNLPTGSYDSISFSAVYNKPGNKNPITVNESYKINFNVMNNKTTILGGILIRSKIEGTTGKIESLSNLHLNKFSLDYSDLAANSVLKNKINFLNATSPILVQELSNKNSYSAKQAHYGFLMDMPCNFKGVSEVNFVYNNDPVLYYKSIPAYPRECLENGAQNQNVVNIFLKVGSWKISSISQLSTNQLNELGYEKINTPEFLKYFQTDSAKFLRNNAYSKVINRDLSFVVKDFYPSKQLFYMGAFEWQLNQSNADFADLAFKRNFSLRDIRRFFREHQIFNGFTGDRIVHDKILGTISVLLQDINVNQISQADLTKLQQAFVSDISTCIQKAEQDNPLLAIDGSILLHSDSNNTHENQTELKFVEKSNTVTQFKACLNTQFGAQNMPRMGAPVVVEAVISSL